MVTLEAAVSNPFAVAMAQICLHIFREFPMLRLFPDTVVEALKAVWVVSERDGISETDFIFSICGVGNIIALAGMAHAMVAGNDVGSDDGARERGKLRTEAALWRP